MSLEWLARPDVGSRKTREQNHRRVRDCGVLRARLWQDGIYRLSIDDGGSRMGTRGVLSIVCRASLVGEALTDLVCAAAKREHPAFLLA